MKDIKNFEKEIQEVHNNFKIMSKRLNELFDEKDNCGIIIQKIVKPIDSIAKSIDNIFCYLREADNLVNENHNNVIDNVSIDYINKKNDIINILKKQNNDANKNNDISKEIKNLLGSMKIIEKQIKLLSLNAEIEASRINQKGGISAIAKQMATLSEKTRDIVAQIENLSTEITRYSNNIFNESDQLMKIIESE